MTKTANLDLANKFTNAEQTILERDICTATYGIAAPTITPERSGQLYFMGTPDSEERELRMWTSYATYNEHGPTFAWKEIKANGAHMDDVALRTTENNFHEIEQTIQGRQIITWIDGGDKNPAESGNRPEFDGQLYACSKVLSDGRHDLAVWMGRGNAWLPMINEAVDVSKLAKLDQTNVFEKYTHMLGPVEHGRQIIGSRRKVDGAAPIADPEWQAKIEGEVTIWYNTKATGGLEITVWIAVSTSGNQLNDWKLIWSSKSGTIDTDNLAKLDQQNNFEVPQAIGTADRFRWMGVVHRGFIDPTSAEFADIMPFVCGEVYIQEFNEGGAIEHRVWMAMVEANAESWKCIYDSTVSDSALAGQIAALDGRQDVLDLKVTELNGELDDVAITAGTNSSDITDLFAETEQVRNAINAANANIANLDVRVAGVEAGAGLPPEFVGLPETVNTNKTDIAGNLRMIGLNSQRIAALEHGTFNTAKIYTSAVPRNELHKHEIIVFKHEAPIDNLLPQVVSGDVEAYPDGAPTGKEVASGHFFPVFNFSAHIVNFKTQAYRSKILDLRDNTLHNEFPMPTGAGALITGELPDGSFGYMYAPMAAPETDTPPEIPELGVLDGRVTILEAFQTETEADLAQFPTVKTPSKYLITNTDGTGYTLSSESVEDVQALAALAAGVVTGDELINVKSIGGQTRITSAGMEQDATSAGNTLILNPGESFNRSIKMPHIADHDVSPLPANHIREGMVMTVLNRGAGRCRLEAQGSDRIDDNGTVGQYFQMESKQGVILFPARYDAGSNRSQYMIMAKFKCDAFPGAAGGSGYDDAEVRGLIADNATAIAANTTAHEANAAAIEGHTATLATNTTAIAANTTAHETNATNIATIETGIDAMATEWTGKFDALELKQEQDDTAINAAVVTLTGRVTTVEETAANAVGTANNVAGRVTTAEGEIDALTTRATNTEASLTATGTDVESIRGDTATNTNNIRTLQTEIALLETADAAMTTRVDGHETRLDAIEAFGEHPALPELDATQAGKYLCVSADGSAFETSTLTNTQALELAAFAEGCQSGDALVSIKTLGGDTALTGNEITQTYFSTGNVVMGTPPAPATNVVVCNMGVIQPFASASLAATDVREGCIITIANLGAGTMRLTPPSGTKIKSGTNDNWETYDVKPGRTVTVFPAIYDTGAKKYIVLSNVGNAWTE